MQDKSGTAGTIASLWKATQRSLQERREAREARRTAERELSVYTTPADLQELEAIMERSDSPNVYTETLEEMRLRAA